MTNTEQTTTTKTTATSIHPETHVGLVALTVSDLEDSLVYYTRGLGLQLLKRDATGALLGSLDGTPLLHLTELKGASPWPRGSVSYTGLYHFAILMPTRADLGRW